MNVTGVIVEYNPLHNGHLYHLQQSVKQTKADLTIAVMSGNFLQRGEPALVSKWIRTKMALKSGVDLVIELPYSFATQKAEIFANGAISLLTAVGATHVCFGSEDGHIDPFIHTAKMFINKNEKADYNEQIKFFISKGNSYPKAASLAFKALELTNTIDLSTPNNILGFHYVKAILEQQSNLKPETIMRTSAQYHDENMGLGNISSATSIRNHLFSQGGQIESIRQAVPKSTAGLLSNLQGTHKYANWDSFFHYLKYRTLTASTSDLSEIYEAEEGLEFRLKKTINQANTFHDFMEIFKTKRYTWTRLQRFLTHVLTNTKKHEMQEALHKKKANYIRLLGMSQRGQRYLNQRKKDFSLPLVSKIKQSDLSLLHLDINAASCYDFITHASSQIEFTTTPIRYNEENGDFI